MYSALFQSCFFFCEKYHGVLYRNKINSQFILSLSLISILMHIQVKLKRKYVNKYLAKYIKFRDNRYLTDFINSLYTQIELYTLAE